MELVVASQHTHTLHTGFLLLLYKHPQKSFHVLYFKETSCQAVFMYANML